MQMTFSPIDIAPDNVSHSHGLGKLNDTYAKLGLIIVVKCLIKPNIPPPPKKNGKSKCVVLLVFNFNKTYIVYNIQLNQVESYCKY